MSNSQEIAFQLVLPNEKDARLVMEWRNDPIALQSSFHGQPKLWELFFKEFVDDYFLYPNLPPLFAVKDGVPVAFLRFRSVGDPIDPYRVCFDISINVSPQYRGQGIGTACLKSIQEWLKKQEIDDLYAEIKIENTISQKTFEHAGFVKLPDGHKRLEDGTKVAICRYLATLREAPLEKDKVFIIAEAGSNWRMGTAKRDQEMAFKLVDIAVESGADAIKFQLFRSKDVYVPNAGASDYLAKNGANEEISQIFSDLEMPYPLVPQLHRYSQERGIQLMVTPFSVEDFKIVEPYVSIHKIASYEIGHIRLLEMAAKSRKPLILSTGAATEEEIAWAVSTYHQLGGLDLTLLQCTAKYPAASSSMNLRAIPWLKQRFNVKVGLSDHSRHPTHAPLAAVALGAKVIEKHFTLDNRLPGPDHSFALMPKELKAMVDGIRSVEEMLGPPIKVISEEEFELRSFARRGIQAICHIAEGEELIEGRTIDILRPGHQLLGLHPKFLAEIEGKRAKREIPLGRGIQLEDY